MASNFSTFKVCVEKNGFYFNRREIVNQKSKVLCCGPRVFHMRGKKKKLERGRTFWQTN